MNDSITSFLDDLSLRSSDQYNIVTQLRKIILGVGDSEEKIKYRGLVYSDKEDFIGIFIRKKHISLEFHNGYLLEDKDNFLEGSGKLRRHIKLRSLEDIKLKKIEEYVKQIDN